MVKWQGAEILGLGGFHTQNDALGAVLIGNNAKTVFEEVRRVNVLWHVESLLQEVQLAHTVQRIGLDLVILDIEPDDVP